MFHKNTLYANQRSQSKLRGLIHFVNKVCECSKSFDIVFNSYKSNVKIKSLFKLESI